MKTIISSRASTILFNWLKKNDIKNDVIMVANICETVPAVYIKNGMRIEWLDIDKKTHGMPYNRIIKLISSGDYVLHFNHTYGYVSGREEAFFKRIKQLNPKTIIVDDRCLCVPATNIVESNADLLLFSTGPKKIVDLGYGGYAFCSEKWSYGNLVENYNKTDLARFEKMVKDSHVAPKRVDLFVLESDWLEPFDKRFTEEEYFDSINRALKCVLKKKATINGVYKDLDGLFGAKFNMWRTNLLVENQKECMNHIFNEGLFASTHYMSLGNGYFFDEQTPNADFLYEHVINLFNDNYFTCDQAKRMVAVLRSVYKPIRRAQ